MKVFKEYIPKRIKWNSNKTAKEREGKGNKMKC